MTTIKTADVRYVKELYPRLKPRDDVIERYRDALDRLPAIVVARGGVLVDGYHRWQAHVRENAEMIQTEDLGDITDAEIIRESYRRNATHGEQLSKAEKIAAAEHLYLNLTGSPDERYAEIAFDLSLSTKSAEKYCAKARQTERRRQQDRAWDLWLDCVPQTEIAERLGVPRKTVNDWVADRELSSEIATPPESRQHFDIWEFPTPDWDAGGQRSYFGVLAPQIAENLLWLYTEPGQIVMDPFAGSGTVVDVAKAMGRRIWASDRLGDKYAPYLPIHQHNIADGGWHAEAPRKVDLVFLDPPYWQQAKGRYSQDIDDMANCSLDVFYAAWSTVVKTCMDHTERIAYIISPTQLEDGSVVDHATDMLDPFRAEGWRIERRIIAAYSTQQATGQQVTWARENKRLLKLYRDLVVMHR